MLDKKIIGKFGETIAGEYLRKKGYKIIAKNYYTPEGEVDLICKKNKTVVFVEVKTRTNKKFGYPEEALSEQKLEKIIMASQKYLNENNIKSNWQIDAICLVIDKKTKIIKVNHIQGLDID